ncbi:polyprenyl synthetase family protein [Nocardia sp. NPDC051570]|uniref:polyprenyl synthetase family protein n=1 Tax=Nocardia sp. NPDC051570 TaxID=3364324 RepID=UPI0037932611
MTNALLESPPQGGGRSMTELCIDALPCLTSDIERVQRRLTATCTIPGRPDLTEIIAHLVDDVPKLVRPTLTLMAAYIGADPTRPVTDEVIDAAVAGEHVHIGTMVHDDVMDEADSRRGRPSVHMRWGNTMAILSGDYHLSTAADLSYSFAREPRRVLAKTLLALSSGQMTETADLFDRGRTVERYLEAITGKTATLLSTACRVGSILVGAPDSIVAALGTFGLEFGIAFQIHDDVLDLVRSSEELGKPAGNDMREGVYTLPTILTISRRPQIRELLTRDMSSADLTAARELIVQSGALADAIEYGRDRFRRAIDALDSSTDRAPHIGALIDFASGMLFEFS